MSLRPMTENEERRYFAGRADWEEDHWQDHCGNPACEQCDGEIPWGNPVVAKQRAEDRP